MNKTPRPGVKRIIFEVLVQILIRRLAEHAVQVLPLFKNSKWVGLEKMGSMVFSIEFNSNAILVTCRDQERTIHAASRADRNPRAQPVPSGQKGSSRLRRKNETILASSKREIFQESERCPALV